MNLPDKSVKEHSSSGRRFGNKIIKLLRFGHFLLVRGQSEVKETNLVIFLGTAMKKGKCTATTLF